MQFSGKWKGPCPQRWSQNQWVGDDIRSAITQKECLATSKVYWFSTPLKELEDSSHHLAMTWEKLGCEEIVVASDYDRELNRV